MTTSHPLFGPCVPSRLALPDIRPRQEHLAPRRRQRWTQPAPHANCHRAAAWQLPSAMRDDANTGARKRGRQGLAIAALVAAALFVLVYRQVLGITQRPSQPPPDAVTPAGAEAATKAFAARSRARPHDAALDFAWSTAATIEPWVEGANFFPRIFEDIEEARSRPSTS